MAKIPPKPDFMDQEAWDALIANRSVNAIRSSSHQHLAAIESQGWGDSDETQGGPTCLITTTGRKSGEPRTTPINYMREGDDLYVVGSIAGLDRHPLWALNLDADNDAEVEVLGEKWPVKARRITGKEREELWPRLTGFFPLWGHFQKYCDREFMVFVLTPRS